MANAKGGQLVVEWMQGPMSGVSWTLKSASLWVDGGTIQWGLLLLKTAHPW